jgi:ABC-type transport system involved in cytochrome c biogenesis permease subunit
MNSPLRYVPWFVVGLAILPLLFVLAPPNDPAGQMQIEEFGKVPIVDHGRIKPIDTVARNSLLIISKEQTYRDANGQEQPAIKWLLEVMTSDRDYRQRPVFTIESAELRSGLGLTARPGSHYSLEDLGPAVPELMDMAASPHGRDERFREGLGRKLLELAQQVALYLRVTRYETPHKVFRIENDQVLSLLGLEARPGSYRYGFTEFSPRIVQLFQEADRIERLDEKQRDVYETKLLELYKHIVFYIALARLEADTLQVVPPPEPGQEWQTAREAMLEAHTKGAANPAFTSFRKILTAYAEDNPEQFNKELTSYRERLNELMPDETGMSEFETFFNHFAPFYRCTILYGLVFVLACCSWLIWPEPLNRAAFWLAVVTLVIHTGALVARMYIQHWRPPVTNLYSSAVFIGWAGGVLGLVLERIYRNGLGSVVTAVVGFSTTLIAHHLALGGETMEMLQAVLDTNFWLATHVTCVTMGYAATFVAGLLGILFVLLRVGSFVATRFEMATPQLDKDLFRSLGQMIYAVVCFATLLSFTGTVLGGIWADQSWGRFWGWDPKENGALLIVLMNALILHARWAGMVKQAGMAVLAICGNMITGWSWFGTNQLGVGLHAYGFNNTLAQGLFWFWISQIIFIVLGLLPWDRRRTAAAQAQQLPALPERKHRRIREQSTAIK